MGQKVHPYGIRLGYTKPWKARWFSKREYKQLLIEDLKIRENIKKSLRNSGVSWIDIERSVGKIRLKIHSARPGIIIGRKGQEIDKLRNQLKKITDKDIFIDIKEVKNPQVHAQLVAENVAQQIEKRVSFRRAMKKAMSTCMMKGASGIKIQCSGRLQGADIARTEGYKEGKVPLSTFRANIDYGFTVARTTYGAIGIKVWIYTENADLTGDKEESDNKKKSPKKGKKISQQKKVQGEMTSNENDKPVEVADPKAGQEKKPEESNTEASALKDDQDKQES